ncbi:MAG: hypothetical protein K5882_02765 [Bacteroidales bacterium]|nr:hypothetical protein [Bacteroidales bacterium]
MSIFGFCIFADDYEDLRQFGHKNNSVACMSIAEDDVDFDEDDEYLPDVRPDWSTTLCMAGFTITGLKTSEGNRSKALRIGQVSGILHEKTGWTAIIIPFLITAQVVWVSHTTFFVQKKSIQKIIKPFHYECDKYYLSHSHPDSGDRSFSDGVPHDEHLS